MNESTTEHLSPNQRKYAVLHIKVPERVLGFLEALATVSLSNTEDICQDFLLTTIEMHIEHMGLTPDCRPMPIVSSR